MIHLDNQKWLSLYRGTSQTFVGAADRVFQKQEEILQNYLRKNQDTIFGKKNGFRQIFSYEEFAANVPLQRYEDLEGYIARINQGDRNVLTAEDVVCFEETSGTHSYVKKIPYTKGLLGEFDRAIGVWLYAISQNYPDALAGEMYLSISPPLKKPSKCASSFIQTGTGDDLFYFNSAVLPDLSKVVIRINFDRDLDPEAFYIKTIEQLLCSKISFVSVWSPTFFLNLDKKLQSYLRERGLKAGSWVWKEIFPSLSLLSCWTDAQSAVWIGQVQERLGDVDIQGKGLLSTEGVVSIPVAKGKDPILAFCSHFFEFRDGKGKVYPAYDLRNGEIYEVILTTGGGLYRYITGDMVQITGFYGSAPHMRFIGRAGRLSDLVGEKLTEYHVNQAVDKARQMYAIDDLIFLCPLEAHQYTLFMGSRWSCCDMEDVAGTVDQQLHLNPYYAQARRLGQLKALDVKRLPENFEQRLIKFLCHKLNSKEGNLKLSSLYRLGELDILLVENAEGLETPSGYLPPGVPRGRL